MDDLTLKLEALLWDPRVETLHPILNRLVRGIRFIYAILRDVLTTTLTLRAMGLVYITIMSIVPMLALAFSALKGFGIHRSRIEPMLLNFLEPLGDRGVELTAQLIGFVDNIQGGLLAGAGLVLLIYTTVSMIKKIEDSLNHVWRVDSARSFFQRFGEYLSIVLVGPLLMVTALGLIASASSNTLVDRVLQVEPFGSVAVLIGQIAPYLLVSIGFALAYWFMPNTRVKLQAALIGGLTGGILWATSGKLFAAFVAGSTRNVDIYASFAVIIIALIWLYISWLILLIGAQASFYYQNPEYTRVGYRNLRVGTELVEQMSLSLMLLVADRFRDSRPSLTTNQLAEQMGVPGLLLKQVRERLAEAGLLTMDQRNQLLPGRDPGSIHLTEVLAAVRGAHDSDIYQSGHWPAAVNRVFGEMQDAQGNILGTMSLYELLERDPAER